MTRIFFIAFFSLLAMAPVRGETLPHDITLNRLTPGAGRLLHGVYPGGTTGDEDDITLEQLLSYEVAVGHRVAWVVLSNNWFSNRNFPAETASWIRTHGATPYIRLMLRSDTVEDHAEPLFRLKAIARGDFDSDLANWGKQAARFGTPLISEFGTEMNGSWFSWNARWNGKKHGAELFKKAYRHIIKVTRKAGASNIVWVFHVNNEDNPVKKWNRFEAYYPGDKYIDWLGVSIYSAQTPYETYTMAFTKSLPEVMARFAKMAPAKPVIIAEFGTDIRNPHENAARWADAALAMILSGKWPKLIGFSWWNETWPNDDDPTRASDFRVQSDAALAKVMGKHLSSSRVQNHP